MLKDSVFSKIIRGELPCYKIDEDDLSISFLTLDAIKLGHSLVIPKIEIDHWMDLPDEYLSAVNFHAKKIAPAIKKATNCNRILTSFVGFEVHHAHYHLVPTNNMAEFDFSKGKKYSEIENREMLIKIKENLK